MKLDNPLVSIIIPTYNRAHLIGETLDSVLAQIYQSWECIVVDDGSKDYTEELLKFYCEKDSRISFYYRPQDRPKGANACRNYGLEFSKGKFINWFDSDDLMKKGNLESKINAFSPGIDFVIGNSLNFDENRNLSRPFRLDYSLKITPENYIGGSIGWITNDVLIRKNCICIKFNENLQSGQEYNFFSRFLHYTQSGKYLKKDIALRRIHCGSIQQNLEQDISKKNKNLFENEYYLLNDLKFLANAKIINRSLNRLIRFSFILTPRFKIYKKQIKVFRLLVIYSRLDVSFFYFIGVFSNYCFGKSWKFIKKSNQILMN